MTDIPFILDDYFNYLATVKGLSESSIHEYFYDLRIFLKFIRYRKNPGKFKRNAIDAIDISMIDVKDIEKIELNDLHAFLAYSQQGLDSPARRGRKASALRSFYDYLVNVEEYFSYNPAEKLSSPKVQQRQPIYLTLEEAIDLLKVAASQKNTFFRYRDLAILMVFLTTGVRLSELVQMNLNSLKEKEFQVIGKGNKERTVYLTESCEEAIRNYLKVRPKVANEQALFLSSRNQRISNRAIQHRIDSLLTKAGFDNRIYSTHKLRHTAATLMYKEGVDIRTLQRILGHSSVSTTQIYTHVDDQLAREAVRKNPLASMPLDKMGSEEEENK